MKHFISLKYFSKDKINELIMAALNIKKNPKIYENKLKGKYIGLLFQKPSLRTKTAFYLGTLKLGGKAIYYGINEVKLDIREKISDVARTLSGYLDGVVLRTFSHKTIEEFSSFSSIPVINGLSDFLHPSQVLGDLLTLYELKKNIKKIKFSYIGDGNNVCHSFIYAFSILGGNLFIATPKQYSPSSLVLKEAKDFSHLSKAKIFLTHNPQLAAKDADVIYTDVWISMGREKEAKKRKSVFKNFQINDKILKEAKKSCVVMHCLPARRGEEITDSVLESKNSIVFLQAKNRLYSAESILLYILGGRK